LMCPEDEERMIISLDMQEMDKVKWVDLENSTACIEAGASGLIIQEQLESQGLTLGHEPDSFEFSTLGGWIATRASGMKKNIYGNIEDFVLKIKFVTAVGTIDIPFEVERKSTGPDLHQIILGSEGSLGVVTEAVVKISKLPECSVHGSVIFPDFDSGVAAFHELASRKMAPASVRLLDPVMFAFGQSLKLKPENRMEPWVDWAKKIYITKVCGFEAEKMCAATILFEGSKEEVDYQQKRVYDVLQKYGGLKAGEKSGSQGYLLTYVVAYLRDYGMAYYFIAESFETTVPWKNVIQLDRNVKKRMIESAKKKGVPGTLWVSVRLTQTYKTCACLYYYFGFSFRGVQNPVKVFTEIEEEAREEILKNGGTLSHHHGVGKLRRQFMGDAVGPVALDVLKKIKKEFDPKNTFNTGNMGLTPAKVTFWKE
jgi:alkyldihydroxyacetonephosphate synthase